MPHTANRYDVYETIAQVSSDMLTAVRDGDWASLSSAGQEVERLVRGLHILGELQPLAPDECRQRIRALRQILAHDAEIRDLTEPWMLKLELMMNTRRTLPGHSAEAGQGR